jgi:hypothetical protein
MALDLLLPCNTFPPFQHYITHDHSSLCPHHWHQITRLLQRSDLEPILSAMPAIMKDTMMVHSQQPAIILAPCNSVSAPTSVLPGTTSKRDPCSTACPTSLASPQPPWRKEMCPVRGCGQELDLHGHHRAACSASVGGRCTRFHDDIVEYFNWSTFGRAAQACWLSLHQQRSGHSSAPQCTD